MKALLCSILFLSNLCAQAGITIGTYNIRNFDYDERYRIWTNKVELTSIIKKLDADVLSIQEINNTEEFKAYVAVKLPEYGVRLSNCGGKHGQRVGFIYKKKTIDLLSFNEDLSITNPGGLETCNGAYRPMGIALFQVKSTKQKFFGFSLHLKSGSAPKFVAIRTKQFEIIKNTVKELKVKTGVADYYIAGDLNTTEYLARGSDYAVLSKLINDLKMVHLTSKLKCTAYWWGGSEDGIETPTVLDHLIATPGLVKTTPQITTAGHCKEVSCRQVPIEELGISYDSVSDHCPMTAKIQ